MSTASTSQTAPGKEQNTQRMSPLVDGGVVGASGLAYDKKRGLLYLADEQGSGIYQYLRCYFR